MINVKTQQQLDDALETDEIINCISGNLKVVTHADEPKIKSGIMCEQAEKLYTG
jgi:hypothetical protein